MPRRTQVETLSDSSSSDDECQPVNTSGKRTKNNYSHGSKKKKFETYAPSMPDIPASFSVSTDSSQEEEDNSGTPALSPVKQYFNSGSSSVASSHYDTSVPKSRISLGYSVSTDSSQEEEEIVSLSTPKPSATLKKYLETGSSNTSTVSYNSAAQNMMRKMGYEKGQGLGKNKQGIVDPVALSTQRGRRGLGLLIEGLEAEDVKWDFDREIVEVEEKVHWIPQQEHSELDLEELQTWSNFGPKKRTIDDENLFCNPEVLADVINCKSVFDRLDGEEMRKARTRSNPFETIRGAIFQNRAAVKMANLDAVFDFMFTNPVNEDGTLMLRSNELLYFADVCAGPGGFSEYVLWRKQWQAKGFGFTLKDSNDFKLDNFLSGPCESFEPHYGVNGIDGDGNVFNPENIAEFRSFVLENTEGYGVHFMMADGGFSVEGQENIQEILSKQLYLCQCLVALGIVRVGGHFVCKLFDVFTPFSVGLVYLMYRSFRSVAIHKPNTSRPANSERYIICKWKRPDAGSVYDYLFEVNCHMWGTAETSTQEITDIVPLEIIQSDRIFATYIENCNNRIGQQQVVGLAKIAAFCKDNNLVERKQGDMRRKCLQAWNVPDTARRAPIVMPPNAKFEELVGNMSSILVDKERELSTELMKAAIHSVFDWQAMVLGSTKEKKDRTFYLGLRRTNIFRWEGNRWQKLDTHMELSPNTVVYGELIQEYKLTDRGPKSTTCFHIIDALVLGGKDIQKLHFKERRQCSIMFAKAMNKATRPDLAQLRVKDIVGLENIDIVFQQLSMRPTRQYDKNARLVYDMNTTDDESRFILPSALLLFKTTEEPWMMAFSSSHRKKYWFHTMNSQSVFECPRDSVAVSTSCLKKRIVWWWDGVKVHDSQQPGNEKRVQRDTFSAFIRNLLPKRK